MRYMHRVDENRNAANVQDFSLTSANQISLTWLAIPGNYKKRSPHFRLQKEICLSKNSRSAIANLAMVVLW